MDLTTAIAGIQSNKSHPIVFVSGLGGSGKTTFAKKLVSENPNAKLFEFDWYLIHSSQERARRIKEALDSEDQKLINQELNPINWYNWDSFKKDLLKFQKNGMFQIKNAWNQSTGELDSDHALDFEGKAGLIICEGLYLLHPEIELVADLSILLDLPKEEARRRGEERDKHRSSPDHLSRKRLIMERYDLPYFENYQKNADLVIECR